MFHSSSSSKSPNCSLDARSLALPSFHSAPSLISQQFLLASAGSHCRGALSDLKIRQASIDLPSKRDFHGPGFPAACGARIRTRLTKSGIMDAIPERYIMTSQKGGGMEDKEKGVSRRQFIETAA